MEARRSCVQRIIAAQLPLQARFGPDPAPSMLGATRQPRASSMRAASTSIGRQAMMAPFCTLSRRMRVSLRVSMSAMAPCFHAIQVVEKRLRGSEVAGGAASS